MSGTITNPKNDRRTLVHTGNEVGSSNVTRSQNAPDSYTKILEWVCPDKYDQIDYAAGVHPTRAELRSKQTADGDGSTGPFAIGANVVPVAGEEAIDDQRFPVLVAYDSDASSQLTVADVDYAANEVTFENAPNNASSNIEMWPVMADGKIQYRAIDQFDHEVGALDHWGTPLHVFSDHDVNKNDSQIHLVGRMSFAENETLGIYVDAPEQIVWSDGNYPEGSYVSEYSQKVDVSV